MASFAALLPSAEQLAAWDGVGQAREWAKLPEGTLTEFVQALGENEVPDMQILAALEPADVVAAFGTMQITAIKRTRISLFLNALRQKYQMELVDFTQPVTATNTGRGLDGPEVNPRAEGMRPEKKPSATPEDGRPHPAGPGGHSGIRLDVDLVQGTWQHSMGLEVTVAGAVVSLNGIPLGRLVPQPGGVLELAGWVADPERSTPDRVRWTFAGGAGTHANSECFWVRPGASAKAGTPQSWHKAGTQQSWHKPGKKLHQSWHGGVYRSWYA
jgi:hypothetical protein